MPQTHVSPAHQTTTPNLSPRERDVLLLLAEGRTRAETAAALWLSLATVKRHLERIYERLAARNAVGALRAAVRTGLLDECPTCGRSTGEEPS